ncbi:MAG TPA: pyridoxamine 5'-phosphate oxidase family protein [Candidatus Binatia bacterium]|nr:pyridoxamine 5'-phosphate oxidase family protein [Candidatus Binatia bacterium]
MATAFTDIEAEFRKRTERIVWCNVTTIDAKNRPRSRILHPLWERSTGWIATGRHSTKERHLTHNPYVSCCYWDPQHEQVYAECTAQWIDDLATKQRVWDLFKSAPPPLGYDLAMFWPGGPSDPTCGILQLTPWRIELSSLADLIGGKPAQVWQPAK